MNFRLFSEYRVTRQLSTFAAAALFLVTLLLVFVPPGSSQPAPHPRAWSVQSTDPAHSLLTLKGSVIVGIDSGMFWVVQFRIDGSGGGQLASFQPNMAVVLESPGSKPLAPLGAQTGGKAQPQLAVVAKSPTASTVFTAIPTSGQTLLIQATGISPVEGVVTSVTGPQIYTAGPPGPPCCAITAINLQTAIVTAKVNSNAQVFTFVAQGAAPVQPHEGPPPRPVRLVDTLRVGQPVWANLTTGQVSLDGKTPCCQITSEGIPSAGGGGKPPAFGVKNPIVTSLACCEITALNQKAKTAGAEVKSNGQAFQIAVAKPALFQSLRVGEAIWANFKTGRVSLNGLGPVDGMQIVGGGPMIAHLPGVGLKKPPYTAIPSPSSPPLTIHDHTLIMQAVVQNQAYLVQGITHHSGQGAAPKQVAIGAMLYLLKSNTVPEQTKERIRVALQGIRRAAWSKPTTADISFLNQVGLAAHAGQNPASIINTLNTLEQKYASQPKYATALRLAKNLVNDGASTIYSSAWVKTNLQQSTGGGVKPFADVLGCADANDISPDCLGGGGGSPYPCPDPSNPACNSCPDPTNPSCQVDCSADPNNPACGPAPTCPDPTEIYPNCTTCPDPTQTYPNCSAPPPSPTPFPTPVEPPPPPLPTPPPTCPDAFNPACPGSDCVDYHIYIACYPGANQDAHHSFMADILGCLAGSVVADPLVGCPGGGVILSAYIGAGGKLPSLPTVLKSLGSAETAPRLRASEPIAKEIEKLRRRM